MKKSLLIVASCALLPYLSAQTPNWNNTGPGAGSDLHYLCVQPDNKNIIYTAGDIEGIFKTTDGGVTWMNINNNLAHLPYDADIYWINEIRLDPTNYQNVYICDAVGLFRSTNGGGSWDLLFPDTIDNNANPPIETSAIAIDSVNPSRLFLGLGDEAGECSLSDFIPFPGYDGPWGVYKSLDGGATWSLSGTGLPDSISVHTIDIIPNSDTIILSSNLGVYRSDNGGATWLAKNTGLPHTNVHRIKVSDDYGYTVLTLTLKTLGDVTDSTTFSGGVFRSDDNGDTWYDITGNLPKYDGYDSLFYDYWKFDIYPGDVSTIYIGTNPGSGYESTGVFATFDAGATWYLMYTPEIGGWMDTAFVWEGYAYDIRIAQSDPSRIVICRDDVEISDDTGNTWHNAFTNAVGQGWKGNGMELMNCESVAFSPSDSNMIYVAYDDFGPFRSDDAGNSYIRLDPTADPVVGNVSDIDAAKDIFIDPGTGDLYVERYQGSQGGHDAGFTSGGLLFSTDNGSTMSDITGNAPKNGRWDVAVDFTAGTPGNRTIYAAIYHNGVYKSSDGGNTWSAINSGLSTDAPYAWDIAINPMDNQELYLGINSYGLGVNGVYHSTNSGQSWTALTLPANGDIGCVRVANNGDVYAGLSDNFDWSITGALYRSTDHGATWSILLNNPRIVDFQVNPGNPNVLLAASQQWYNVSPDYGLYLSQDNGTTWQNITQQNINHTVFGFARFSPHNPREVFAGTGGGGLWRTTLPITVGITDGIKQNHVDLNLYPNPARDYIAMDLSSFSHVAAYQIFDASGRMAGSGSINNTGMGKIYLSGLKPSVYIIKIYDESHSGTASFIKE